MSTVDGSGVFSNVVLEGLSVGSSLTSFGSLLDSAVISSIYVDPANPVYSSDDGMLLTKDGKQLLYACARQSVTVPDGVEVIKSTAFNGKSAIQNVTLASSVRTIESGAFSNTSISSIDLSEVSSIGNNAFYGCTSLLCADLGNSLTSIPGSMFYGCISLSSVSMPESIAYINDDAFSNCSGLREISFPSSLTCIGS